MKKNFDPYEQEMVLNEVVHHNKPYMWCARCGVMSPVEDYAVKKLDARKGSPDTFNHQGTCPECGDRLSKISGSEDYYNLKDKQ